MLASIEHRARFDSDSRLQLLRMTPIRQLLARIRWDPEFGRGRFELAYLDRKKKALVRVPLDEIVTTPGERFAFQVTDEEGQARSIPYHRVREVWRDGERIWAR